MRIAQITDTHIRVDGEQQRYLSEAIAAIDALQPRPDVVLLTGDTTDTGRPEQYAILRAILARCPIPVYLVPGNHDRPGALRAGLPPHYYPGAAGDRLHYTIDTFAVRLIGLDTFIPPWPGGALDDAGLDWLEAQLDARPTQPTLLFMHHPPFRTGINAADLLGFRGQRRLTKALARRPAVTALIAGHIHCERSAPVGNAIARTALSTAPQVLPELFERRIIGLRREPAGFAVHTWTGATWTTTTYLSAGRGRYLERSAAPGA